MNRNDLLRKKIKAAGLKATQSRICVLDFLMQHKAPVDIRTLEKSDLDHMPNRVTLYRMMEDFTSVGLIRRIDLRQGRAFYEVMPEDDHHHIVCVSCGDTEDIDECILDKHIDRLVEKSAKFSTPKDHAFEIFSTCRECSE